ncbi:MAG: DUF3015 family protein [Pseudobacteriovorax sp.]|nr:DUF3015 family protein [Pseudobacteriovorax sp.]
MLLRTTIIGLCLALVGTSAFAKKKKKKKRMAEKTYEVSYGMAGCGLWSSVLKGKDQGTQIGVWALRNFILNSQTTAITSGLSNCVEGGSMQASIEQEVFVSVNLSALTKEAARGEGDHLYALAEVLGCQNHLEFAKLSQEKYASIYGNIETKAILESYTNEIQATPGMECTRII